jgi:ATP:corrinoid adenosyltransferase
VVGQVCVYTGEGREKTAAALGSAMKAPGAGFKVFVTQFFKEPASDFYRKIFGIPYRLVKRFED